MPLQVDLKSSLTIGELAREAGLSTSAIRYYESIGLVPRAARRSGRRVYGPDAIERLRRIALGQASGFSLDEIRELERGFTRDGPPAARWRRLAATKLTEVTAQIERLRAMHELLHATLDCSCESLASCPLVAGRQPGKRAPGAVRR